MGAKRAEGGNSSWSDPSSLSHKKKILAAKEIDERILWKSEEGSTEVKPYHYAHEKSENLRGGRAATWGGLKYRLPRGRHRPLHLRVEAGYFQKQRTQEKTGKNNYGQFQGRKNLAVVIMFKKTRMSSKKKIKSTRSSHVEGGDGKPRPRREKKHCKTRDSS